MCWMRERSWVLILTTACSCTSFFCLCIGIVADHWLYTCEHTNSTNYKNTTAGLWRKCVLDSTKVPLIPICEKIDYFKHIDRDGLAPSESILLSLRKFMLFPVVSLLVLLAGECCCVLSQCDTRKNTLTLVSGILFVVGGLFVLIGIVIFIGAVTEEAGNTNKPRATSDDQPKLLYNYGPSFILTILSFITSECTGVLSVYLYISLYQVAYRKDRDHLGNFVDVNSEALQTTPVCVRSKTPPPCHFHSDHHHHQLQQQQQQGSSLGMGNQRQQLNRVGPVLFPSRRRSSAVKRMSSEIALLGDSLLSNPPNDNCDFGYNDELMPYRKDGGDDDGDGGGGGNYRGNDNDVGGGGDGGMIMRERNDDKNVIINNDSFNDSNNDINLFSPRCARDKKSSQKLQQIHRPVPQQIPHQIPHQIPQQIPHQIPQQILQVQPQNQAITRHLRQLLPQQVERIFKNVHENSPPFELVPQPTTILQQQQVIVPMQQQQQQQQPQQIVVPIQQQQQQLVPQNQQYQVTHGILTSKPLQQQQQQQQQQTADEGKIQNKSSKKHFGKLSRKTELYGKLSGSHNQQLQQQQETQQLQQQETQRFQQQQQQQLEIQQQQQSHQAQQNLQRNQTATSALEILSKRQISPRQYIQQQQKYFVDPSQQQPQHLLQQPRHQQQHFIQPQQQNRQILKKLPTDVLSPPMNIKNLQQQQQQQQQPQQQQPQQPQQQRLRRHQQQQTTNYQQHDLEPSNYYRPHIPFQQQQHRVGQQKVTRRQIEQPTLQPQNFKQFKSKKIIAQNDQRQQQQLNKQQQQQLPQRLPDQQSQSPKYKDIATQYSPIPGSAMKRPLMTSLIDNINNNTDDMNNTDWSDNNCPSSYWSPYNFNTRVNSRFNHYHNQYYPPYYNHHHNQHQQQHQYHYPLHQHHPRYNFYNPFYKHGGQFFHQPPLANQKHSHNDPGTNQKPEFGSNIQIRPINDSIVNMEAPLMSNNFTYSAFQLPIDSNPADGISSNRDSSMFDRAKSMHELRCYDFYECGPQMLKSLVEPFLTDDSEYLGRTTPV